MDELVESIIRGEKGSIEDYLTPEKITEYGFNAKQINNLIRATGDIGRFLTPEIIKAANFPSYMIANLIESTGDISKYLTPEIAEVSKMYSSHLRDLIIKTNDVKSYLTIEKIREYKLDQGLVSYMLRATGEIEKYLTPDIIKETKMVSNIVVDLIKETGNVENFLTIDKIKEYKLSSYQLVTLIKESGNIGKYLNVDVIEATKMDNYTLEELLILSGDIEKYFTVDVYKKVKLYNTQVLKLIKESGKIESFLTKEKIAGFDLRAENVVELIKETEKVEEYLSKEKATELGLENKHIAELMNVTGDFEKYLSKEIIEEYGFEGSDIAKIIGVNDYGFIKLIDNDLKEGTYNSAKIMRVAEIMSELQNSNSSRLSRISVEIALQVYEMKREDQQKVIEEVKQIYATDNLPNVAKDFLIFEQLHPRFVGEQTDSLYYDRSNGNIPSLENMNPQERKHTIFSDLLRISIESGNRDLKEYLSTIEEGDKYFNLVKEGKLKIDENLPEDKRKVLERYAGMLNALYNQTSKGKRANKPRENNENLEQDLMELEGLFNENSRIHLSMPDRIVRTFGYWAGIRSFEQAKQMIEDIPKKANDRNIENAKNGKITLKKGDFVKGIADTKYFPSMLENGIVAKDYLGQSAKSDATPLDMDVELIVYEGVDFRDTYKNLKTAPNYTNGSVSQRSLGKIMLVFENDGSYVKTREGKQVNDEAIELLKQDKSKKEFFDNNGAGGENAHGVRTGEAPTKIKCIVADRYVDKLGLEIAIKGIYIPIINDFGEVIFTPEMYDDIRSKMQGISHYGMTDFKLDESAKNIGTTQIKELIEPSIEDASKKRKMILETLEKAIEESGLEMLTEREKNLLEGFVEVVDTGSTGRGTNNPGDGDFDFMVRLDSSIFSNSDPFKDKLKKALLSLGTPEEMDVTAKGDFRYKGVKIEGLSESVDIDLTFSRRTDEIGYTTEECIKDRLRTIKNNSPENYEYVVANILLAKKVLKEAGAYKKKTAPEPEKGQIDTRGGLGAVGIENWILQNGGSFEKAARSFLEVARDCDTVEEFQDNYSVWDFGENYIAGDNYPHDNFVYNMNKSGYNNMKQALEEYVQAMDKESEKKESKNVLKKGIGDLVQEDMEVLENTPYMNAVKGLMKRAREIGQNREAI